MLFPVFCSMIGSASHDKQNGLPAANAQMGFALLMRRSSRCRLAF
jgi:hypothetical protein